MVTKREVVREIGKTEGAKKATGNTLMDTRYLF